MRILYTHFKAKDGGGDTYILTLAKALASEHSISIAAPEHSSVYQRLSPSLPCFAIHAKPNWRTLAAFKRWVNQQRPDIIHNTTARDHLLTRFLGPWLHHKPRWVYTRHCSWPVSRTLAFRLRYLADAIIAVSRYAYQQLSSSLPENKLAKVIRNGVDTDVYRPVAPEEKARLRTKYQLQPDDFVFVSVAGTDAIKNWITLVEAVSILPAMLKARCKIIVAGSSPASTLTERVKQLNMMSKVIFPGMLDDVREVIAVGDVGFVLSYAAETISFACREMMAMGLPVIVSDFGGLPENITPNKDGWIVPPRNVPALKACVEHILTSANLSQMGQQARQKAESEFSHHQFASETAAFYQECLDASVGSSDHAI
jgi:L-malate glycosyltransferase